MKTKNLTIRLNMNKEDDRRAYEYLQRTKGSYTKTVVAVICEYEQMMEQKNSEDRFAERLITAVREEIAKNDPLRVLAQMVQTSSTQLSSTPLVAEQESEAESEETLLGFLDSF